MLLGSYEWLQLLESIFLNLHVCIPNKRPMCNLVPRPCLSLFRDRGQECVGGSNVAWFSSILFTLYFYHNYNTYNLVHAVYTFILHSLCISLIGISSSYTVSLFHPSPPNFFMSQHLLHCPQFMCGMNESMMTELLTRKYS